MHKCLLLTAQSGTNSQTSTLHQSGVYFFSVNATFIASIIKTSPHNLFIYEASVLFFLNLANNDDAKNAKTKHQIVPVVINVVPNNKKGKAVFLTLGSTNCGKKAIKNKATFGFKIFVNAASR